MNLKQFLKSLKTKGALLIEYGVILAFVCVVGVVFLNDSPITGSITAIFSKAEKLLAGETATNKDEGVKNLIAGNVTVSFLHNMNENGDVYGSSNADYPYQNTITSLEKDNKFFTLETNSTYEFIIDPTVLGDYKNDYSFTLKLFRNEDNGYKNVFDSNGIYVWKADNDQWNKEALVNKQQNVPNMKKYDFSVDRMYNDNNTITYTIKTGDTSLSVAGQIFANRDTSSYHMEYGDSDENKATRERLTEFGNAIVLTKKE